MTYSVLNQAEKGHDPMSPTSWASVSAARLHSVYVSPWNSWIKCSDFNEKTGIFHAILFLQNKQTNKNTLEGFLLLLLLLFQLRTKADSETWDVAVQCNCLWDCSNNSKSLVCWNICLHPRGCASPAMSVTSHSFITLLPNLLGKTIAVAFVSWPNTTSSCYMKAIQVVLLTLVFNERSITKQTQELMINLPPSVLFLYSCLLSLVMLGQVLS